jgi:DUF1680 family protein
MEGADEMKLTPVYKTAVTGGVLADRIRKNTENLILEIDAEGFAAIFSELHDPWFAEPEFAGQYVDICVQEYKKSGNDEFLQRARVVVKGMIDGQREDGYLGTYKPGFEFEETFGVWNEQFVIKGLVSFYELTGDEAALEAAKKCADYIANYYLEEVAPDILKAVNQCLENTCILEQYARLYRITGKQLYLDFAEFIVKRWEETTIKFITAPLEWMVPMHEMGALKAVECLICYHGIIELHKATGDQRYLDAAKAYWEIILGSQINVIGCGAYAELWVYGGNRPANTPIDVTPNETCVAYSWMRLCALLFELTGESKYIDTMEKTLYNHIIGAQAFDGSDFSYYQGLVGKKVHAKHPGQYSCCRYRGMAFLSYVPNYIVTIADNALLVNLFVASTTELSVDGVAVTISQETDFPRSGRVRLTVALDGQLERALKIRRPVWADSFRADCSEQHAGEDGYVTLAGPWQAGTFAIDLELEMTVRAQTATVDHLPSACVTYGPVTLAIDSRYGTPIHSSAITVRPVEGATEETVAVTGGPDAGSTRRVPVPKTVDLRPIETAGVAPMVRFECDGTIDGKPATVTLVDFGSAGSLDKENDWFKVWLPVTG